MAPATAFQPGAHAARRRRDAHRRHGVRLGKAGTGSVADGHRRRAPGHRGHRPPPRRVGGTPAGAGPLDAVAGKGGDRARAPGGRPGDRALELPGPVPRPAPGLRLGRRQYGGRETLGTGTGHVGGAGQVAPLLPRRRRRHRGRGRPGRCPHPARTTLGPCLLHRERAGRPPGDGRRGPAPDTGDIGAGREKPGHRRRLGRHGHRGPAPGLGEVPQRRADVRGPGLRPRGPAGGGAPAAGAGPPAVALLRGRAATARTWPGWSTTPTWTGWCAYWSPPGAGRW